MVPLVKAIADPVRLRLLSLVASHVDGEACVCDLNDAFDLSQPTISHHLKVLHEAGLLDREKRGVWVYYRANTAALTDLASLLRRERPRPPSRGGGEPSDGDAHHGGDRLRHRGHPPVPRSTPGCSCW